VSADDPQVRIAVLNTELEHMRRDMDEVKSDLKIIRETLQQAKGGWKTLMLVAGISSTVGAFMAKLAPWIGVFPK
jgi:hypothetical protein